MSNALNSSNDGLKWHEHAVLSGDEFNHLLPEDLTNEEVGDNVHRIITSDFPRFFALVSRPKVEYGLVGPSGGLLSVNALGQEAVATFPEQALVKTIKVALQALPVDNDMALLISANRLRAGPVLTVEPRRRKFHKLINLTLPSPAGSDKENGLRLLYSLTEGNSKAEWEDLTDSVDFNVTESGSVSFMTNVSARFWVVQVLSQDDVGLVEQLASDVYKEAIKVPYLATFAISTVDNDFDGENDLKLCCRCGTKLEPPADPRIFELTRSKPVELYQDTRIWVDVVGDIRKGVPNTKFFVCKTMKSVQTPLK